MTSPSKAKGDRAEREVEKLLRELGYPQARRKLGAGRQDDMGDIEGVLGCTIQVCDWKDVVRAVRQKPLECEEQRLRAGTDYGATFVRLWGGEYRVVLTLEQWNAYQEDVG